MSLVNSTANEGRVETGCLAFGIVVVVVAVVVDKTEYTEG